MACGIKFATALVACFAIINAVPIQFPRDKTLIYNYYGDVKAGIIEPAAYASQYAISGQFYIKPDTSDPGLPNAFVCSLRDVKTGLHNGLAAHYERTKVLTPIPEPAKVIEDPFLMVYDNNGKLQGVKMPENEPGWSKNMKLAMVTMFQLDLVKMKLDLPIKPQAFMSKENTIHGDCWNSYEIHQKDSHSPEPSNEFTITKFGSPRNCTNYNVFYFNHVENEGCELPQEKPVNMASRKVYQVEKNGENVLIKTLIAHGGVNYFPWKGRSEAHYILNNATFVFEGSTKPDISLPKTVDFTKQPLITDISFQHPDSNYAERAGIDVTQGRHPVDQSDLINKIKLMLIESVDYLHEDHLKAEEPDFKHGQTMNRMLITMGFMDVASFEQIFNEIDTEPSENVAVRTIFLAMVPNVGTHASTIFIKNIIMNKRVALFTAIEMLIKLPMNVRQPTEQLLIEMEPMFMRIVDLKEDSYFVSARRAAILSFASLTFRTFKNSPDPKNNELLNKYLNYFYDVFMKGDDQMKTLALMAMRNIQVGRVFDLLAPVIRGDVAIPKEESTRLRLLAIWAVEKSIPNYETAHDLLWPVMADYSEPLKLRIAAYDILIHQAPTMTNILHLYWFMVYEKNEHLYNYHHTTIKGLANSVDPCNMNLKELTTKIIRFTRFHTPVPFKLSASYMADAVDKIYGHGDKYSISYTLNERSGYAEVINVEHNSIEGRKRTSDWKIQIITDGGGESVMDMLHRFHIVGQIITSDDVKRLLLKTSPQTMNHLLPLDVIISYKGRVIFAKHYLRLHFDDDIEMLGELADKIYKSSHQMIYYDSLYEQQVISEMGLPVVMQNRVPVVSSVAIRNQRNMPGVNDHKSDLRLWRHGDYSMSIYNPLLDVWHTIRRSTATDIILPLNFKAKRTSQMVFELFYPQPLMGKSPSWGTRTHAKDCTTVTEDDNGTLQKACPTCSYDEVVTNGPSAKRHHEIISHSKDIGLQFTQSIFDCENGLTPVLMKRDLIRGLFKERKNAWGFGSLSAFLAYRQHIKNILISPRMGSCGLLYKKEVSTLYPTSQIKLTISVNGENLNKDAPLKLLMGEKKSLKIDYEAIDAVTLEPARSWAIVLDTNILPGREHNAINIYATRKTPGEKNLNICLNITKTYPPLPMDILKVGLTKEETKTSLGFSMTEADDEACSYNGALMMIDIKGGLSEEQKKKFLQESISGACATDERNPLYKSPENFVPKTASCLDHAMKHTTLRNYDMDITYSKIPPSLTSFIIALEDEIKALFLPNMNYTKEHTEEGKMKINVEFPMQLNSLDLSVTTPSHGYDILDAEISERNWNGLERDPPRLEGFGPDPDKHLWMAPLDNTRFSLPFLTLYTHNQLQQCSVYPKIITTLDGGEIPYVVPEDWTLLSGDSARQTYAIFVKKVGDQLSLRMFANTEEIEISPVDTGFSFKINHETVDSNDIMANGTYVPQKAEYNWSFKIATQGPQGSHIFIRMRHTDIITIYTSSSITLGVHDEYQGRISGLCGSMDGRQRSKISQTYRLSANTGDKGDSN